MTDNFENPDEENRTQSLHQPQAQNSYAKQAPADSEEVASKKYVRCLGVFALLNFIFTIAMAVYIASLVKKEKGQEADLDGVYSKKIESLEKQVKQIQTHVFYNKEWIKTINQELGSHDYDIDVLQGQQYSNVIHVNEGFKNQTESVKTLQTTVGEQGNTLVKINDDITKFQLYKKDQKVNDDSQDSALSGYKEDRATKDAAQENKDLAQDNKLDQTAQSTSQLQTQVVKQGSDITQINDDIQNQATVNDGFNTGITNLGTEFKSQTETLSTNTNIIGTNTQAISANGAADGARKELIDSNSQAIDDLKTSTSTQITALQQSIQTILGKVGQIETNTQAITSISGEIQGLKDKDTSQDTTISANTNATSQNTQNLATVTESASQNTQAITEVKDSVAALPPATPAA